MNALRELSFQELIAKRDALAQEMHASMTQEERDVWRSRYWSVQSEINFRTSGIPRHLETIVECERDTRGTWICFVVSVLVALCGLFYWFARAQ